MKGVVIATALVLLLCCCIALANPPLVPPVQYEQFCEAQKVSGSGVIDVSTSIVDKKIALEYYNNMAGDGDFELDQEHAYSQNSDKLLRNITSVNGGNESQLNLFEQTKLTYASKDTPLMGNKFLHSKAFYGGIGAKIQESFAVYEMEKDQTSFFVSTTPYNPQEPEMPVNRDYLQLLALYYPQEYAEYMAAPTHTITPEQLIKKLKDAGRDTDRVAALMGNNPAHVIGLENKDINAHEMFSGIFEAEKTIKFHENPVPERDRPVCDGIDC